MPKQKKIDAYKLDYTLKKIKPTKPEKGEVPKGI
jgi:hypothetical protein